jgi:hypothetical protein
MPNRNIPISWVNYKFAQGESVRYVKKIDNSLWESLHVLIGRSGKAEKR